MIDDFYSKVIKQGLYPNVHNKQSNSKTHDFLTLKYNFVQCMHLLKLCSEYVAVC